MKKILVALSGGVDSAAAAAVLQEQGYTVEGATMDLLSGLGPREGCGSSQAVADAKKVAEHLGIRHHVFDFSRIFRTAVVEPFMKEYVSGRTPNPCVMCNHAIKFGAFLDRALDMGFDAIATGHYGEIVQDPTGIYRLKMAPVKGKDQSYVLYRLNQHMLSHLILPIGCMEKAQVRQKASQVGLDVANKKDSQEICFIPDGDYAAFLMREGCESQPGWFVNRTGERLGKHKGLIHYTVGQRKGLGVALGRPQYVLALNTACNEVVLGDNEETFVQEMICRETVYLSGQAPQQPFDAQVKIRYSALPAAAHVVPMGEGKVYVRFCEPQRAVTPGQSAVFYDGEFVLGGGIIETGIFPDSQNK